jgi:protein-disulfide isomerase
MAVDDTPIGHAVHATACLVRVARHMLYGIAWQRHRAVQEPWAMRSLAPLLVLVATVAVVGCENAHSPLDDKMVAARGQKPVDRPGATPLMQGDHSGDVETRLRRLEDNYAKYAEALDFLGKVYAQQKAQEDQQARMEHDPDAMFAVDVTDDVKLGAVDGSASAGVTIVKAFDFACPYCQRVSDTLDELVKDYGGKVRVVYKNLVVHPQVATDAHLASCAAAKQGKYKEYKNAIWEKGYLPYTKTRDPSTLAEANLMTIASGIGLNADKLKADMRGEDCKNILQGDQAELQKFQVNSTPTFFINGKHIGGALDKGRFKMIIDQELEKVNKSGVSGAEYYAKVVMGKGEKQFRSKMDPKPN